MRKILIGLICIFLVLSPTFSDAHNLSQPNVQMTYLNCFYGIMAAYTNMSTAPIGLLTAVLACAADKGFDFAAIYLGGFATPLSHSTYDECETAAQVYGTTYHCPYTQVGIYNMIMTTIKNRYINYIGVPGQSLPVYTNMTDTTTVASKPEVKTSELLISLRDRVAENIISTIYSFNLW